MTYPNSPTTTSKMESAGAGSEEHGESARGIVDRVKERATAELNTQRDRASAGIGTVAQAVRQSTQQLREQQHEQLAHYVSEAADRIDSLARQLRTTELNHLLADAQRLARRQPAVFVGSAFVVGLLGARFFKSSSTETKPRSYTDESFSRTYSGASMRGGTAGRGDDGRTDAERRTKSSPTGGGAVGESASSIANRGGRTRQPSEKS